MGKTSKWLRSFLTGKKDKDKEKKWNGISQNSTITDENPTTPVSIPQTPPKEKRRWSFRRSSASATASRELSPAELNINNTAATVQTTFQADEQRKHAMAVAAATAAAADASAAATQVAAAVIRLNGSSNKTGFSIDEAAAIKIQSVFRSYLARKALCALKGLVKLQALVRGHLVRKQANATLRCMQALVTAQARALAQRIRVSDGVKPNQKHSIHRKSTQENRSRSPYQEIERSMEENIKIVEMDYGESNGNSRNRKNYLNNQENEWSEKGLSAQFAAHSLNSKQEYHHYSPVPSALTDFSPRAYSGHFEDYSFNTAQSSPQYYSAVSKSDDSKIPFAFPRPAYADQMAYDYPLFPNYMANTESSKAKVRSQSAPKQRPDSFERQPSRRRASIEGRNVPRAVRMQRSSSHVGSTSKNYQYPWSLKLDKSTVSLKESECGSTSTVLTNTNYCRSLVAYNPHGDRY